MAVQKSPGDGSHKDFKAFLAGCPAAEGGTRGLMVSGFVLRSASPDTFILQTADGQNHEIPSEAVVKFTPLSEGAQRAAMLELNAEKLDISIADKLRGMGTAITNPYIDTQKEVIKEAPFDTFKEAPFDTLKEPVRDTLKELVHDTIKEIGKDAFEGTGPGDTLAEGIPDLGGHVLPGLNIQQMQATGAHQPLGGTYPWPWPQPVPQPAFTNIKRIVTDPLTDPIKHPAADTNTGIADSLVENIRDFSQFTTLPQFQPLVQAAAFNPAAASASGNVPGGQRFDAPTIKETASDPLSDPIPTIKEAASDPLVDPIITLKETASDPLTDPITFKEANSDPIVDPIKPPILDGHGTGIADTLVESIGPGTGPLINPGLPALAPFVLATPHHAPAGALAQQYLAAQAMQGGLGLI